MGFIYTSVNKVWSRYVGVAKSICVAKYVENATSTVGLQETWYA